MNKRFKNINPAGLMLFGWLVPGLGHYLQGKKARGIIFFSAIFSLLIMGLIMRGKFWVVDEFVMLKFLGFVGSIGNGIFYLIIKLTGLSGGDIKAVTHHYGTLYLTAAGLLNFLIALNAFDLARTRDIGQNTTAPANLEPAPANTGGHHDL